MGKAFRFGGFFTILFLIGALVLRLVLRETGILMFWNYVVFGIPILLVYFLLAFLYFTISRKQFLVAVVILILLVGGYLLIDSLDNPKRLPVSMELIGDLV